MADFDAGAVLPCIAAFGEVSLGHAVPLWQPPSGAAFGADGIFDRHGASLTFDGSAPDSVRQPRIFVRQAECDPQQGWRVTLRGTTWLVTDTRPDGLGGVVVTLGGLALGTNPA